MAIESSKILFNLHLGFLVLVLSIEKLRIHTKYDRFSSTIYTWSLAMLIIPQVYASIDSFIDKRVRSTVVYNFSFRNVHTIDFFRKLDRFHKIFKIFFRLMSVSVPPVS